MGLFRSRRSGVFLPRERRGPRRMCFSLLRISSVRFVPYPVSSKLICRPRVLPNRPSHRFSVLYASPPSNLLPPLQCLVSPRCAGRLRGAVLQPVDYLRRGAGYGDRSVYHGLSARFPELRVASLGDSLPELDFDRHGEPLYAHVRDAEHGRGQPQP